MRINTYSLLVAQLLLLASLSGLPFSSYAQSFRYMDESGNIHFVDSISDVPPRYRNQVLAPTPAPTGKAKRTPKPKPTKKPKPVKSPKPKKTQKPKKGQYFPEAPPGQFPVQPPHTPAPVLAPSTEPSAVPQPPTNPIVDHSPLNTTDLGLKR